MHRQEIPVSPSGFLISDALTKAGELYVKNVKHYHVIFFEEICHRFFLILYNKFIILLTYFYIKISRRWQLHQSHELWSGEGTRLM